MADLNYTLHKGQFVKEEDLVKKRQESRTTQILLKHGIRLQDPSTQENHDQVRAAIKELFPKIPHDDLEAIVKHAWAEGTGRVGSAHMLDLPRRVQLAVIARIRHQYTDYDRLLRAFEWSEARKMTEPVSLQKLIEWRGEQDVEDDDQLEEMVRETIVIDDDEENGSVANGSEADDEDSATEQGDHSDASIEVTQHLADDTDIGGESTYEGGRHPLLRRFQQVPRRSQRQQNLARQKLAEAFEQRRLRAMGGPPPPYAHPDRVQHRVLTENRSIQTVHVPSGSNGGTPTSFAMGGVVYHPVCQLRFAVGAATGAYKVQIQEAPTSSNAQTLPQQPQGGPPTSHYAPQPTAALGRSEVTYHPSSRHLPHTQDRPVASIERGDGSDRRAAGSDYHPHANYGQVHARPATPEAAYSSKRRRIDPTVQHQQHSSGGFKPLAFSGEVVDLTTPEQPRRQPLLPFNGDVVDLSTPEPRYHPVHPSPLREEVRQVPHDYGGVEPQRRYEHVQHIAPPRQPSPMRISPPRHTQPNVSYRGEADSLAYDPTQPMLQLPQQVDRLSIRPEQHVRPVHHGMPGGWPLSPAPPQQQYYELPPQQSAYPPTVQAPPFYAYPPAPPPRIVYEQQQPSRPTPQPIHGAPAPVQVLPRHVPHPAYGRPPTVPPPLPPTDGAPAPVQVMPRYAPHAEYR